MTKGKRLYKDMKALGEIEIETKKQRLDMDMDMDKEGATLKKEMDQSSQTREAHKQREQAHELRLIAFDMCIVMCLLALHKFLNDMHACVVYASCRT